MSNHLLLPNPTQIQLMGVYDRGVPNSERIVVHATEPTQMGEYGLLVGIQQEPNVATPIPDVFFWFGTGIVKANSYLLVYTGSGEGLVTTLQGSGDPAYIVHWGRRSTLFADSRVVPILIHIDGVGVGRSPENMPQLASS